MMKALFLTLIVASNACFGVSISTCATDATAKDITCPFGVVFNDFSTNVDWTKTNAWEVIGGFTDQSYYLDLYTIDDFATPWWYDATTGPPNYFLAVRTPPFKSYGHFFRPGGPGPPAVITGTPIITQHFCRTPGTGSFCNDDLFGRPLISQLTVQDSARSPSPGPLQVHTVGDPVRGGTVDHLITEYIGMPEPVTPFLVGSGLLAIFIVRRIVRRRRLSLKRTS
jgi:hypothetical protein